jgi:dihydroflavonol-4-reductase
LSAYVPGPTPPVLPIGPIARRAAGFFGDLVARLSGREPDINSASTAIAAQKRRFSSARADAELGYRVREFVESTADAWAWFRQHGYA